MEGRVRFDKKGNPLVHAMLFTDMLVFVEENPEVDAVLVVRQRLFLASARVKDVTDTDYLRCPSRIHTRTHRLQNR